MKLFVAGLGRTGTQSIVAALQHLGLRTASQEEFVGDGELLDRIAAAVRGQTDFDWSCLGDVDALVGWPMCFLYAEAAEAFPHIPVLLNTREPDAWFDSVNRVWPIVSRVRTLPFAPMRRVNLMLSLAEERLGGDFERETWTAGCRAHEAAVRAAIPAERLVEYPVGSGWEPICEALGVPVPDRAFPRSNTSASGEFSARIAKMLGRG